MLTAAERQLLRQLHADGASIADLANAYALEEWQVEHAIADRHIYPGAKWGPAHVTGARMPAEPTLEQWCGSQDWTPPPKPDPRRQGERNPQPLHRTWMVRAIQAVQDGRPHPYRDLACPDPEQDQCIDDAERGQWLGFHCSACPRCLTDVEGPPRTPVHRRDAADWARLAPLHPGQLELFPREAA